MAGKASWLKGTALPVALLIATPAHAWVDAPVQSDPRVTVLPVNFQGELEEHWRVQLEERLLKGLERGDFEIVRPSDIAGAAGFDPACEAASCYAKIASQTQSRYLIRTRIVRDDRDYRVTIDIVDPSDASIVAATTETCNLCGASEVGEIAEVQASVLRKKLDALVLGPPTLVVASSPSGAAVYVDGKLVGNTPLRRELIPGPHVVKIERDGYVTEERSIDAVAGLEDELSITLGAVPRQWQPKARNAGWATLSIGAVGIVTGSVLIAIHDRPYQGRCGGADVDDAGNCRFAYDTLAGGITALVTGVVLAATGTALVIVSRRRRGSTPAGRAARLLLPRPALPAFSIR